MPNPVAAVVRVVLPARLGSSFRWLWSASMLTNIGDGIALAAGPLLIASQTRDPFLVSLAFFCEFLPSLVLGSVAGVVVDRMDRRRIIVFVNLVRAVVLGLLAAAIATGTVSIAVVLAALLLLGTAETFADLGSQSLLPRLVPSEALGLANARLQSAHLLVNELIGPPIGAFLFVVGMAIPFATDAICFLFGAILVSRISASAAAPKRTPAEAQAAEAAPTGLAAVWHDLAGGFRWLRGHPPMRTLALTIVAFNVTFGAAWSVLVLYAGDRLGMDSVGFGLLTTASAIGGIAGTALYGPLERRFSLAQIMRGGLLIETLTHLTFALTTSPAVALATMVVFGAHEVVWWTTSVTIRQRAVPDELMGRVGGIYTVGLTGGIVIGTPIGGLLAKSFGITAPFWFGFVGSAVLVTVLWREFRHIAHDDRQPASAPA
ncbi:MAG TPA: MFS transporter [Patescibacteria group bacterium]|nr:MFS transporter [Patescibacteria group bacterium]